ncbi:MAG: ComF family protein, partial [Candidatus Dormibacteraceae bacterium]
AIHRLKYEGRRPLARPLARLVCDRLAIDGAPGMGLLAVPLHRSRLARRGFNQSELIVRELRVRLRLPEPPGRLVRARDTPAQVGLDRAHRLANVSGAFDWQGPDLGGMPVILVDDVITTGATLEACAAALRAGGAGAISGLTVARVSF